MKQMGKLTAMLCGGLAILLGTQCTQPTPERVVVMPQISAVSTDVLEIDSIVRGDSSTVFYIQAFFRPKNWIQISKSSFLTDNLGNTYPIQQGIGIDLGNKFWMPESGHTSFQLVFPPLHAQATSVDFSEGDFKGAYNLWGIQLTNRKQLQVKLPAGVKEASISPKDTLPEPICQYGTARLEGHILNYKTGMSGEAKAYLMGILQGRDASQDIRIADDGSFELLVPAVCPVSCKLYMPYGTFDCLLAPAETTVVYINPAECARRESRLRREDAPIGKRIYYAGYLAGLQQELEDHKLPSLTFASSYEEYQQRMNDIADMNPEEFKAYMFRRQEAGEKEIETCPRSEAFKELARIKLSQTTTSTLAQMGFLLKEAHIMKHNLNSAESQNYFRNTKIDIPQSFYDCWEEFPLIFSSRACYCNTMGDWIETLSYPAQLPRAVAANENMSKLIQANRLLLSIQNFNLLTDKQCEELKTLPEAYRQLLEAANEKLIQRIEANKRKVGANIHEIETVKNEDLFPAILSKFRGHTVLVDFWATWCGPCKMAHKEMAPLKKDWKEKDIVYIYIAGENSPEGAWKTMIPDIPGEHFRITQSQWDYLAQNLGVSGVPTYLLVDKNGNIKQKMVGFPGVDRMKELLEKMLAEK